MTPPLPEMPEEFVKAMVREYGESERQHAGSEWRSSESVPATFFRAGAAYAYEKAAKVAEDDPHGTRCGFEGCGRPIAAAIRALAGEGK